MMKTKKIILFLTLIITIVSIANSSFATKENLEKATTEELLQYNEQINRIKAVMIEMGL